VHGQTVVDNENSRRHVWGACPSMDSMRVTFGQMDSMRAPICSGGFAEKRSDGINDELCTFWSDRLIQTPSPCQMASMTVKSCGDGVTGAGIHRQSCPCQNGLI
jgi:hypothetical protein